MKCRNYGSGLVGNRGIFICGLHPRPYIPLPPTKSQSAKDTETIPFVYFCGLVGFRGFGFWV